MYTRKPGLAALGFALTLLTTPSYGQQIGSPYVGPPHNIVYWNGNMTLNGFDEYTALLNSYYTDVIINFVTPDSNCNIPQTTAWQQIVQDLHKAGKTVLIAFGNASPAVYQVCSNPNNIVSLAQQLGTFVNSNGFDGVDIDFEDTGSFGGNSGYDGIFFLNFLTFQLYYNLQFPNNIITHAPQTPYWTQTYSYTNAGGETYQYPPYYYVYQSSGPYIAWFNNQFYNQGCPGSGIDCTAQQKFDDYSNIVSYYPLGQAPPSIIMVMGFPISYCSTADNGGNCNGDGWIGWSDPGNGNDTSDLITLLQRQYPNQFGGIMGWNFDQDFLTHDYYGQGGWSYQVWGTLFSSQTPWYADNLKTWQCLDSNGTADTCANLQSQFWQFEGNSIVNTVTGLCLDAGQPSLLFQCFPSANAYQSWEFLGTTLQTGPGVIIRNRWTNKCLDAGQTPAVFVCNGGPWQQWTGGSQ
jgi:Glycosyl hydrolases family 18